MYALPLPAGDLSMFPVTLLPCIRLVCGARMSGTLIARSSECQTKAFKQTFSARSGISAKKIGGSNAEIGYVSIFPIIL